ncbi:MAG: alpha/beta hydrolase [Oscillospiraceae bacterium]|nr:alpha/beta hydrolase [Oscillospiraceae bacterium]
MLHETFKLKPLYPALSGISSDPTVTTYLPYNLSEMGRQDVKNPAVLICPGGGYSWCSQREDEPVALKLLSWGYRVFILNYSCTPSHFPAQLCEVAAALELIYANADVWHIDVDRIAIMGFSAGGHLAGHYCNRYDCPEVRNLFPNSKGVKAAVLCYPVICAAPEHRHEGTIQNVIGHQTITEDDEANFSLDRLVSDATPATFLWHTAEDDVVPVSNSILYAKALAKHRIPFDLHIFTHGQHGLSTVDALTCDSLSSNTELAAQWLPMLRKWLSATL